MTEIEKESLITAAKLAANNAKPIKSKIAVGCVLRVEPGERGISARNVSGCNIEMHGADNIHAEMCALSHAIAYGYGLHDVTALGLWFPLYAQAPCGACLQGLATYFKDSLELICAGPDKVIETTLGEALPFAYRCRDED